MLKKRIITALILAPLAVYATLVLPSFAFAIVFMVILLAGMVEWTQLCSANLKQGVVSVGFLILISMLIFFDDQLLLLCAAMSILYWLVVAINLYRKGLGERCGDICCTTTGVFFLLSAWSGLVLIHRSSESGPVIVLMFLVVIWAADIMAYFAGKKYGHRKLCEAVSPGKTVEGVIGGCVGVLVVAVVTALFFLKLHNWQFVIWVVACILAGAFSVVGDLNESRYKRLANVKDSGNLLPGHGGVLDRIDGLIAAIPVFSTIWILAS